MNSALQMANIKLQDIRWILEKITDRDEEEISYFDLLDAVKSIEIVVGDPKQTHKK